MERTIESLAPGLTDCPAWPALKAKLMAIGLDGTNPYDALQRAFQAQPLDSATDAAAALSWRLQYEDSRSPGPLTGLPPVPAQLVQHPEWGRYFDRRIELLNRDADRCRAAAAMWTAETAPAWAARFAEHDRDLTGELAVWRAVNAAPDTDTRPTGPPRTDLAGWLAQPTQPRPANPKGCPRYFGLPQFLGPGARRQHRSPADARSAVAGARTAARERAPRQRRHHRPRPARRVRATTARRTTRSCAALAHRGRHRR
jgi:hypothetical protein